MRTSESSGRSLCAFSSSLRPSAYRPSWNASRPPGEWQSYDVVFIAPRFKDGNLDSPAHITVFHNGILVQDNEEPFGPTSWLKWLPYTDRGARGAISLHHGLRRLP